MCHTSVSHLCPTSQNASGCSGHLVKVHALPGNLVHSGTYDWLFGDSMSHCLGEGNLSHWVTRLVEFRSSQHHSHASWITQAHTHAQTHMHTYMHIYIHTCAPMHTHTSGLGEALWPLRLWLDQCYRLYYVISPAPGIEMGRSAIIIIVCVASSRSDQ